MESDSNIYKPPKRPPEEQKPYTGVDLTPRTARRITVKRVFSSIVLIAAFLGASVWLFLFVEERGQREDLEDLTAEEFAARTQPRPPREPAVMRPEMPSELDAFEAGADEGIEPAVVAEAMRHIRLGREYLRAQEWDRAEQQVMKALDIWPDMGVAKRILGFIYVNRGQLDEAVLVLNEALKRDPFDPEVYNTLAAALIQQGVMGKAEELLLTSLELRPDYISAHMNLGMLYILTGQYEWAAEQFERVLESMPDHAMVRNNLGVCLIRMGRYREAQAHFQHLIDRQPDEAAWYFNMAITYTEQQDFDTAMTWVRRGANLCSPIEFQRFMADQDFEVLRARPEFKEFRDAAFPTLPVPLGT